MSGETGNGSVHGKREDSQEPALGYGMTARDYYGRLADRGGYLVALDAAICEIERLRRRRAADPHEEESDATCGARSPEGDGGWIGEGHPSEWTDHVLLYHLREKGDRTGWDLTALADEAGQRFDYRLRSGRKGALVSSYSLLERVEPLMRVSEVAEYLNLSEHTIRNKVQADEIPYKKVGGALRFRRSEIDAWIEEQSRDGGE